MCQQYEAEARYIGSTERAERQRKFALHESGEVPMTDDELRRMAVEALMARDAGF